ncbi:MAG: hypothetical protein A2X12_09245 [Bacteroidetes bacterium GWE2_29_8]|nr:MAG: hypothetical protein A2X12_09245 [Bacteroidetes bacterium GWE2_29_8]OFY18065.1 MAG: hypothetical protein A2X02_05785 [Bacteroidetes bacterium GWF2_29_10]
MALGIWDVILLPVYLTLILVISQFIQRRNLERRPEYKYYLTGLTVRILAGILFCLIYVFYYGGGDTLNYYEGGKTFQKLLLKHPDRYMTIFFSGPKEEYYNLFDFSTGYPPLWLYKEDYALSVMKFVSLLLFFSFNNYLIATMILVWLVYTGVWRLFLMFCEEYPDLKKEFSLAILFIPSVVFWSSGILKDPLALSATGWQTYSLWNIFIKKRNIKSNIFYYIISFFVIMKIKPYILYALIPGTIIWIVFDRIKSIEGGFLRMLIAPIFLLIGLGIFSLFYSNVGTQLGKYSVDEALDRAAVTQQDLATNTIYGDNKFDIGAFEPTIPGILSKAPQAIMAGVFRPFIWEAKSPFTFVSALENLFLLLFGLWIIFKVGLFKTLYYIQREPLVFFGILFTIVFAFIVGLTTANFGALVRYKIPLIPLYLSSLFIIRHLYQKEKEKEE